MVNPIRVIGHVNDVVETTTPTNAKVQRAVVPVAAAVHLGESRQRQQDCGEDGE